MVDKYKQPLYPVSTLSNGSWNNNFTFTQDQTTDYRNFMKWANYSEELIFDFNSPYWFDPLFYCYADKNRSDFLKKYMPGSQPIIAYIKSESQIQSDLLQQLQLQFSNHIKMPKFLKVLFESQVSNTTGLSKQSLDLLFAVSHTNNETFESTTEYNWGNFTFKEFENRKSLFDYVQHSEFASETMPGVCFGLHVEEYENKVNLNLMFVDVQPIGQIPGADVPVFESSYMGSWADLSQMWHKSGFSIIQNWVANTILKRRTGVDSANILTMLVPYPHGNWVRPSYEYTYQRTLYLYMLVAWIPFLYKTVYRIVQEKQTKMQEVMRMMGMKMLPYWLSWYTYYTILNALICVSIWLCLQWTLFPKSEPAIFLLLLFVFGQSLFGMILTAQTLFDNPNVSAIILIVFYFSLSLMDNMLVHEGKETFKKLISCVTPSLAFSIGLRSYLTWSFTSQGCNYDNWEIPYSNVSVKQSIQLLMVSGIFWLITGVVLDLCVPTTYGSKICSKVNKSQVNDDLDDADFESKYYEPVSDVFKKHEKQKQILTIQNLRKVYPNQFKAVDGIDLKIYQDQIFVLLGHNGAGKTTLISLLSGLYEPTDGKAFVYGHSLCGDNIEARRIMGVCPQYDVLFDLLTPQEHLEFFYEIKCAPLEKKQEEIQSLLKDIGHRDFVAMNLSGGNKRKLSAAIAFVGGSKFLIFDEPTAGMDLNARRQLWNMLKKRKKDKIILMSTHYMDEADILGDRIGVMCEGKLSCVGSSMFLKKKFGHGYNLTALKSTTLQNTKLIPYMQYRLGIDVVLISEIQSEMCVNIPEKYSEKFTDFFQQFDRDLPELQIMNYSISISTLESVFMKISNHQNLDEDIKCEDDLLNQPLISDFSLKKNFDQLDKSFMRNFHAILFRRLSNRTALFIEILLPLLTVGLGIFLGFVIDDNRQKGTTIMSAEYAPYGSELYVNPTTLFNSTIPIQTLSKNLPKNFNVQFDPNWNYSKTDIYSFLQRQNFSSKPPWHYGDYVVYQANDQTQEYKFFTVINSTSQHTPIVMPQLMYQSILKHATNTEFNLIKDPFPTTRFTKFRHQHTLAFIVIFITSMALAIALTTITQSIVSERVSGRKHLQILSGMNLAGYWSANFFIDFMKIQIVLVACCFFMWLIQVDIQMSYQVYLSVPASLVLFTYASSFIFGSENSACVLTLFFNLYSMSMLNITTYTLRTNPRFESVGDFYNLLYRLIPQYVVSDCVNFEVHRVMMAAKRNDTAFNHTGEPIDINPDTFTNVRGDLIFCGINAIIWLVVLVMLESCKFKHKLNKVSGQDQSLDQDVLLEQNRIYQGCDDFVQVENFSKHYTSACGRRNYKAVKNLCLAVDVGQCFALLGVNGAGKTTTFKCLTNQVMPTAGKIIVDKFDLNRDFNQARKLIGYCPQHNLVFENMSVQNYIKFYALLKGIPTNLIESMVDQTIKRLELQKQRFKAVGNLSGGNQRKVCAAVALIGNPPVILLDEPSAGMDPKARRFMWQVIAKTTQEKQSAIILTTHSMEEAEALSTKMGIMVNGGILTCFGSSQHIRNKFGTGYVIEIKITTSQEQKFVVPTGDNMELSSFLSNQIQKQLQQDFQNCEEVLRQTLILSATSIYKFIFYLCPLFDNKVEIIEMFGNCAKLRVSRCDKSMGFVFGLVEKVKQTFQISEYSVSQTTLEQIFQQFTNSDYQDSIQQYTTVDGLLQEFTV